MTLLQEHSAGWMAAPPRIWESTNLAEPGLRGTFFESVPFKGKTTRVFAWIGLPEGASPEHPVPGMVLVHGGGGSAFSRWVRWWNARGYAAIAMDTCGAMPLPDTGPTGSAAWPRHSHSGPAGWGGFDQITWDPEDQWTFHAAAAVIKSHTLLASLPEVDAGKIGLTGISWGGFLTSLVAGLDSRFTCAMPVYGCAFTEESMGLAQDRLALLTEEQKQFWIEQWAPSSVIRDINCPMLWLNGSNDFAFHPPSWQKSAAATNGPRQLCFKHRYPHGHMPVAEEARELEVFANSILKNGQGLISVEPATFVNGVLSARYGEQRPLRAVSLLTTPDTCAWPDREWHVLPVELDTSARVASAQVPKEATAACLTFVSEDWLTSTSDLIFPQI